jgi:hypothetical protein
MNAQRLAEIREQMKVIEDYYSGWKKCRDGSYERFLCENSQYDKLWKEWRKLCLEQQEIA